MEAEIGASLFQRVAASQAEIGEDRSDRLLIDAHVVTSYYDCA
jgi:hypothetical protein